ncbi:MAG: hypothetical protein P8Y30_03675 [candidate division WOR-3 bacterium]
MKTSSLESQPEILRPSASTAEPGMKYPGDMIFSSSDTINGVTFNSSIRIDSFHFDTTKAATKDEARGYSSGSRIWSTIETIDLSNGDTIQMQTVFSHHR